MSRLTTGLAVGIPAAGAVLLYETMFRGLSLGYDADAAAAISRTVPKQRQLLREQFAAPAQRTR
jgi:hypothetical protein